MGEVVFQLGKKGHVMVFGDERWDVMEDREWDERDKCYLVCVYCHCWAFCALTKWRTCTVYFYLENHGKELVATSSQVGFLKC